MRVYIDVVKTNINFAKEVVKDSKLQAGFTSQVMKGGVHWMSSHENWVGAGPAGLVALAVACFCFFALLTGKVDHSAIVIMGVWLIGGFVIQIITALLELKEGNLLGGNVFTFFSAYFMLVTGCEMLVKFWAGHNGIAIDARISGWAWLAISAAITLWLPAYFAGARSLSLVVASLVPALWIIAFKDLGFLGADWAAVAGYLALLGGILGIYTSAAIILNNKFSRVILPLGSPFIKSGSSPQAVSADS
ncbi:MAG: acetate uptake transporter family protein [Syntrophomonadaceae bacterium]